MVHNKRSRLVFILTMMVAPALAVVLITFASAGLIEASDAGTGASANSPGTVNWTAGVIPPTNTATSLSSSASPSFLGASVTFTVTVTPSAATGTVQLYVDGAPLGSAATLVGGTATVSTASLTVGTHVITAEYSGDDYFDGSTSAPLEQQIVSPGCTSIAGVDFDLAPAVPKVGQLVSLHAVTTGGTPPITYTWNYGDGTGMVITATTTVMTAVHSYPLTYTVRTFTVTLTAANLCSSRSAAPRQVTVYPYYYYVPEIIWREP